MEFPCVSPDRQEMAKALEERIGSSSALAHSALADACQAAAEFDQIGGWCAPGIRSFAHWLAINAGFNLHSGSELLRVGQALKVLPRISQAFSAGRLSFDKVRQITTVAAPATEDVFLEIALGASGSQLARICSSLRRIANADAPDHDQRQLAERGLWTQIDEDGMMRLVAKLLPEDAAVVMAAIESIAGSKPVGNESDLSGSRPGRRAVGGAARGRVGRDGRARVGRRRDRTRSQRRSTGSCSCGHRASHW